MATSKIADLVGIVFDDIPYSSETSEAQEKIEAALDEKYTALCESKAEGEALDELLAEYGSLTKMAQLAGYSEEQALAWRSAGDAIELKPTKKLIWKQRRRAYAAALFSMFAFTELEWVIYNAVKLNSEFFFVLVMFLLFAFLVFGRIKNIIKTEREIKEVKYDNAAFDYLRKLSDKYTKQLYNSIALIVGAIFIFLGSELSFYIFGNSKSAELGENFFSNMIMVEIPLFILVKNIIREKTVMRIF